MEEDVKKRIVTWLRLQEFVDFIHDNDKTKVRARKYTKTKALPDLIGNFVGGRAMYVEVKDPSNNVRRYDQLQFLEERRRQGAFACLANSVEQLRLYLRAEGFDEFNEEEE